MREPRKGPAYRNLRSQWDDRIDSRRAVRRDERRDERHREKQQGDAGERQRIARADAEEERGHEARQRERRDRARNESDDRKPRSLREHEAQQLRAPGAERDTDAEL